MKAFAHLLRAVGHKHGVRPTQVQPGHSQAKLEFAQKEIINLFPRELPEKRPRNLVRKVREALAQNPDWLREGYEKPISARTVKRAWQELQRP